MHTHRAFRSLCWIALVCAFIAYAKGQVHVQIRVSDGFGNTISVPKILITGNGETKQVRSDEVFTTGTGRYTIEVESPGSSNKKIDSVLVDQTEQIITIALTPGALEGPPPRCLVRGRIQYPNVARVRLIQLSGSYVADVAMKAGGFEFVDLECGDYLLIVIGEKNCLGTMMLRTALDPKTVEIRLPEPSQATCTSIRQ